MTHLVYGYPGSGKSTLLTKKITDDVANGHRCFLIVPEQQTVEAERRMAKLLPASAQLSFEVLNFSRLANKAFRLFGGLSYHYITPGSKMLLMWQTLSAVAGHLKEYTFSRRDDSLPGLMLSAIAELRAWNISTKQLDTLAQSLAENHPLKNKLYDLSLVATLYESTLKASFDDVYDDLDKLADIFKEHPFLKGSHIYIDGFTDYTKQEYNILRHLMGQAEEIYITVPAPADQNNGALYLKGVYEGARILGDMTTSTDATVLDTLYRASNEELKILTRHLWDNRFNAFKKPVPEEARGNVSLYSCENPYEEADAAASQILSLIQDSQYRFGEIAVVVRDTEQWRGILDSALEKCSIPFFLSDKTNISEKPLVAAVFAALAVRQRGYQMGDVIAYLKTGIPGILPEDVDLFESYLSTWNIHGKNAYQNVWDMNPDGYQKNLSARAERMLAASNIVREELQNQWRDFFDALDNAQTAREYCQAVFTFLKKLNVEQTLLQNAKISLAEGNKKEAAETAATLRSFVGVLSDINATLGDDTMSADEFVYALKTVLDNTDIGTIPTAADEVLIGSASLLRAENIRCAILLGVNESVFPAKITEQGFFTDADRLFLEQQDIHLSGNTSKKVSDELFYFYRSVTLPSEKLILMYHKSEMDGNSCTPSLGIARIIKCLPYLTVTNYGSLPPREVIYNPTYAFELLPRLRNGADLPKILKALKKDENYASKIALLSHPIREPKCFVEAETVNSIYGEVVPLSQTILEKYVSCHFSYYCKHVLGLREEGEAKLKYNDIGTLVHRILEKFMKVTAQHPLTFEKDEEQIKSLIQNEIQNYRQEILPSGALGDPQISHIFDRLYRLILLIVRNLLHEANKSDFKPSLFEFSIGIKDKSGIPSPLIDIDQDKKAAIEGTVDRVDSYTRGNSVYLKVIDYKTGAKQFSPEDIKDGFNLQLLLYLFSLCNSKDPNLLRKLGTDGNKELCPAGIVYLSTAVSPVSSTQNQSENEVLSIAEDKITRQGLLLKDEAILRAMNRDADKKFLLGSTPAADGTFTGNSLVSTEEFKELFTQVKDTVKNIAREMISGNACAYPVSRGKTTPCEYCRFKRICRIDFVNDGEDNDGES